MSAGEEPSWEVVGRKKGSKKGQRCDAATGGRLESKRILKHRQDALHAAGPDSAYEFDEDVVINKIFSLVPILRESYFYRQLEETIRSINSFESLWLLGVGSLTSQASILQMALALLLKDLIIPTDAVQGCTVFDPLLTPKDIRICQRLHLAVKTTNDKGKIRVDQRSLFFMPHCPYRLYSNVLWANWGSMLQNIAILGNSFESYGLRRMDDSIDGSDCVQLLSIVTNEVSVWTAQLQRHPCPIALDQINVAFSDLSLMTFPADLLAENIDRIQRPSETDICNASDKDTELF